MSHETGWRRFLGFFGKGRRSQPHRAAVENNPMREHDRALMGHVLEWQHEIAEQLRELVQEVEGKPDQSIERLAADLDVRRQQVPGAHPTAEGGAHDA